MNAVFIPPWLSGNRTSSSGLRLSWIWSFLLVSLPILLVSAALKTSFNECQLNSTMAMALQEHLAQQEQNFQFRCSACDLSIVGSGPFALHFRRVGHDLPIQCGQGQCEHLFNAPKSLLRHIRDIHFLQVEPGRADNEEAGNQQVPENQQEAGNNEGPGNQQEAGNNQGGNNQDGEARGGEDLDNLQAAIQDIDLTRSAARMVLNLRQSAMTTASIQRMQHECFNMMVDTSNLIKLKLIDFFRNEQINTPASRQLLSELVVSDPFIHLRTMKQQLNYFAREMGLVVPVPMFLDWRPDYRLNPQTNQYEPTQVPMTFEYIPIIETLKLILSNPKLRDLINSEEPSSDGVMRPYLDGSSVKKNDLISQYPHTLRIQLNWDDLEVTNALGSKTSIHKLAAFYFSLQNFPPVENSQLATVYLLALAYSEDIKAMKGFDKILEPFLQDLKRLESAEGVTVRIGDELICIRATLVVLCADSLAAHDILGLLSPSARHFCRSCLISRQELHRDCTTVGEPRTAESFAAHVEQVKTTPAFSRECGVKRDCPLKKAKNFSVPEDAVFDIFHDMLEGVCHLVIILALYAFVVTDKFFSLSVFNARVAAFNYGIPDSKNRPSVNITEEKLKNKKNRKLNQSGIQMWCLVRAFGFLVPEVPEDHPHLRLVNFLQEIMLILFSRAHRLLDSDRLDEQISSFLRLFQTLYVGDVVDDEEGEEEEEEDVDEPEEVEEPAPPRAFVRAATPARKVKPINKLHHMAHFCAMLRKFGPLILYWCARYEGRHHIFCKYAAVCCNFINIPMSMAQMHQISTLCAMLKSTYRAEEIELHSPSETTVRDSQHAALLMAKGLQEESIVFSVQSVVIAGEDYRAGLFVIADASPCFAIIQHVYVHEETVYFVIVKWETEEFVRRYCAYRIKACPVNEPMLVAHKSLQHHGSYAPWNPFNQRITHIAPRFLIF